MGGGRACGRADPSRRQKTRKQSNTAACKLLLDGRDDKELDTRMSCVPSTGLRLATQSFSQKAVVSYSAVNRRNPSLGGWWWVVGIIALGSIRIFVSLLFVCFFATPRKGTEPRETGYQSCRTSEGCRWRAGWACGDATHSHAMRVCVRVGAIWPDSVLAATATGAATAVGLLMLDAP